MRRNEPFDHSYTLFDLGILFLQASKILREPMAADGYWFRGSVGGSIQSAWDESPSDATNETVTTEHYIECLTLVMRQFKQIGDAEKECDKSARLAWERERALYVASLEAQP